MELEVSESKVKGNRARTRKRKESRDTRAGKIVGKERVGEDVRYTDKQGERATKKLSEGGQT